MEIKIRLGRVEDIPVLRQMLQSPGERVCPQLVCGSSKDLELADRLTSPQGRFFVLEVDTRLAGFVRNHKQLQGAAPLVLVSSAMLGGAFWPIEIVKSGLLLAIAKFIPLYWAMEGLKEAVYQTNVTTLPYHAATVLLLMTVILMGLGIVRLEKKSILD